ncbi:MAG: DUF5107 domain-containing protein [Clostridiales bacterium]|nr:DUF5107 domain-containing protein [Clostridiales bacterium]MDY4008911.1 DUF5107 domain-containing protein [Candidatus Limiplasma sp.]
MQPVTVRVETMAIPTYPIMASEKLPMFNENRMHQGTKGNPYPVKPVLSVMRENCQPRNYEVVRMENDFIRLILIPELGGRIFEAYDKVNQYDFLYRQHCIKPALIGAYGLWISGGLEFNWPFHHRPSTFMPVNFSTETQADGTAITWLSECDPTDRTRCTIGIVLRPDAAYFETRIQVTNRTPLRHSFLMWQNAAVPVNDDYQFIFPPDVNYANNHYSLTKPSVNYPIAHGSYASAFYDEPTDISWYKNCFHATSHFAAPSKYDFFGGYDHGRKAGVIHVANHHISPGKKMFTWGCGKLAGHWEKALTDTDGRYCELMAGSYSNNQPDFTWLNPYEAKAFSQFWYPIGAIGKVSFATLDAAVRVALEEGELIVQTTKAQKNLRVVLKVKDQAVFDGRCDTQPCKPIALHFAPAAGLYSVALYAQCGGELLHYTQEVLDEMHYPEPLTLDPHPDNLKTVQELYLQGVHKDQYRNPQIEPDVYYEEALRRDPNHIPSLIALGEYKYRHGYFAEAKKLLEKAIANEHLYNQRYQDGEAEYLLGLVLDAMGETDRAYGMFYSAAWSGYTVSKAMSKLAAIDGRRKDYNSMLAHAVTALEASARHPIASAYAALAQWKLGNLQDAMRFIDKAIRYDPLNDLAVYVKLLLQNKEVGELEAASRSDFGQTALDIAFDLADGGFVEEAFNLLTSINNVTTPMVGYTAAYLAEQLGRDGAALRKQAALQEVKTAYPYRLEEIRVLKAAVGNEKDAAARNLLACALYDKGHFACASQLWREAHALDAKNAAYARNLAVACFSHMKCKEEALRLLVEAMELEPQNDQLKLEYLYAATKLGAPGAERLRVIKEHPLFGKPVDDYVLEHAKAYCVAGRYEEARKVMMAHDFVPAEGGEIAIIDLYFTIMLHLGREAMKTGDLEKALALFESALELPENLHAGLWFETAQTPLYYYQAVVLEKLGRAEESKAMYEKCLYHRLPTKPDMPFYYASAMRKLGREVEARILLSKVTAMQEERSQLPAIGWEDTVAAFNPFVNNPQEQRDGMVAYQLAGIRKYVGDQEGARKLYQKSLALWPENMNTWMELDFLQEST